MKKLYLFLGLLLLTVMGVFAQSTCTYNYSLHDSYGDGWNGASIVVKQGSTTVQTLTISSGNDYNGTMTLDEGVTYTFEWNEGNYDSECSFEITFNGVSIFACADVTELDPNPFLTIIGCSTCFPPSPDVVAVYSSGVDIAWASGGNTEWEYTYGSVGFDPDGAGATVLTATDTLVNISGLNTNTSYDFYIRTVCDPSNNQVSSWKKISISMPQDEVGDIPYSTGFETDDDCSWVLVNGNNTNKWYLGSAVHSTGSRALYISDNNGTTYSYDGYEESDVWAYRDIDLGVSGTDHMLSFDWKCEGYYYSYGSSVYLYDYMEVYIGIPSLISQGAPAGATLLGQYYDNTSWQQENILISNQFSGIQRLYFHWVNTDWSYESNYPAAIDNVSVTEMTCGSIDSVSVSNIMTDEVTLTPHTATNATDFVLYYKEQTSTNYDSVMISINTDYTLSNLNSGTTYDFYMKMDCGNDNYGFPTPVMSFTTHCDYITAESLPYTEGFEPYDALGETFPTCWNKLTTYYNYYYSYPVISSGYSFAGDYSMNFDTDTDSYNLAVLPGLDATLDVNTLTLSFMMLQGYSYYGASHDAIIGVLTDASDLTTFVPVDTVTATSSSTWNAVDVSFANYTGTGKFIGILNKSVNNAYAENNFYIDEVVLYVASDCQRPADVTASDITSNSATISWTPQGTETSWNIVVVETGGNPDTVATMLTSDVDSIVVSGLNGNTRYDAFVQADCGAETSIWTSACSFLTECSSYSVPFLEDFDDELMPPSQCWALAQGFLDTLSVLTSTTYGWSTSNTELSSGFGSHVYYNIYGTSRNCWLISPSIDLGDGSTTYQLDLDVKMTAYSSGSAGLNGTDDIFAIVVSTDNGNTWRKANAFIWDNDSTSNSYGVYNDLADVLTHLEISLVDQNDMPYSGLVKIALYGESTVSNADNNLRVDNFAVNPLSNCPRPTSLTFSNIMADQFTASWVAGGTESSWNLVVVPDGTPVTEGVSMPVTDTFATVTNLDANTSYKVYLQADCGLDNYSGYVVGSVHTACVAIDSIPYFEGFENYSSGSNSFPDCWTNLSPSGMDVYVSNYQVPTGSRALYFYTYNEENGLVAMPQFDPTNYPLNTLQVSFSVKASYSSDQVVVGYVTNLASASSFVGLDTVNCTGSGAESFEIPLSQCNATDAWIAFKTIPSPTAYSSTITLDNISVDLIPDCPRPNNLHVASSTTSTIDLAWTPVGSENEWEIVYDVTSFDPDNATPISVYTTPATTISNLSDTVMYYFYVRAVCGAGDHSPWRGPISATPGTYLMPISGMHTVTMCGGNIFDDGGLTGDYSSNCDVTVVVNPDAAGQLVEMTGTYDIETGSSSRWDYLQIFDGTTTTGTTLFDSHLDNSGTLNVTSISGSLTLYFHSDGSVNHSGFEIHVSCSDAPTCPKPMNLTASSSNTAVTLSWTENGTATTWDIEYGAQGFTLGTGTMENATTNPFTVNNLTTGTAYDFYVRANCGSGEESEWVGPVTSTPGTYILPATGEYTVTMCGGTIYDDGGVNGNYSTNCDVTVVVNPDTPGSMVHLTGTFDVEENYDLLTIYDGVGTTGTVLFDSDEDATLDVVSTTGSLTIHFESDGSVVYGGFEITVDCIDSVPTPPTPVDTCHAPANVAVTNVTTSAATVDWTQAGTPDSWIISYKKGAADTWTTINTTTKPYTITNLEAETSYSVFVKAVCGDQESTPSATVNFTTQPDGVNVYANSTIVYPNPTTGKFRIENSELRIEYVEVFDVYGKLLQTIAINDNSVELDLSTFASGMYLVRVMCDEGSVTKSIIKK